MIEKLLNPKRVSSVVETLTESISKARKQVFSSNVVWKELTQARNVFEKRIDDIFKVSENIIKESARRPLYRNPVSQRRIEDYAAKRTARLLNKTLQEYGAVEQRAARYGAQLGKHWGAAFGAWYGYSSDEDPSFKRVIGYSIAGSFVGGKVMRQYAAMQFSRNSLLSANQIKHLKGKLGKYTEKIVGIGKMNL